MQDRRPATMLGRAGLLLAALACSVLVVSASPAGAADGPAISVTPSEGLQSKHVVTVTGTGLDPGGAYLVTQCGGPDLDDCEDGPSPTNLPPNAANPQVAGDGTFTLRLQLDRHLVVDGDIHDCLDEPCWIRLASAGDPDVDSVPLSFVSGIYEWPEATIDIDPSQGLVDGQEVEVTGSGYSPWFGQVSPTRGPVAPFVVCRDVDDPEIQTDCQSPQLTDTGWVGPVVPVDPDGGAAGPVTVDRHLELPGGSWDCAVGGCTARLDQQANPASPRVPLGWAPEWAPWPDGGSFADAVHGQMVGAPLSPSQEDDLVGRLAARQTTGVEAVVAAVSSTGDDDIEPTRVDQLVGEVTRLYVAFFGRRPDTGGLRHWVARRQAGASSTAVVDAFGSTPEFRAQYQGLDDRQVVERAYLRAFGRPADPDGLAYWRWRLAAGMSRARFVQMLAQSPEMRARQATHVGIEVVTYGLLDRAATAAEWDLSLEELVTRVLGSDELAARVG